MRSKMKIAGIISLLLTLLVFTACRKDFEEIDTNPQGFTTASDGSLFNGIIQSMLPSGNEQFYVNNEILYKQTQQAALTQSAWGNYTIGTEDIWGLYYRSLPSVRELQKRFKAYPPSPSVTNMEAMLKITLAYKTFKLTDLFGDIPYSEAGYGFLDLNYLHPKYDKQRDIYLSLLDDLKWAADNINDTTARVEPFVTFASFDKLFRGDLKMWRKFANSLRLRYAMRMSGKEPQIAGGILKEIIEKDLPVLRGIDFTSTSIECAALWPAQNGFTNSSVSWSFREHNGLRMGSNLWHQLSTSDNSEGTGIFDPRAYIFFEGDQNKKWKPYPQVPNENTPSSQGIPYGSHRDDVVNYEIKNNVNYSPFNFFLIDDENFVPVILMTSAEVYFIKAEALFRGIGVAVDKDEADNEYINGVLTSVKWWTDLSGMMRLPLSGMKFTDKITIPSNLNTVAVLTHFGMWNAHTDDEKLGFIYTQRWIDAFRQPWEAYAETRRTAKTPHEGALINHFRMPYPPSESQYNTANWNEAKARQGGEDPGVKMWWMAW